MFLDFNHVTNLRENITFATTGPINSLSTYPATQTGLPLVRNKGYLRHLTANIGWLT